MALEFYDIESDIRAKIKVVGVGGGGGNAVNNMIASQMQGVTFISANTDAQVLVTSQAEYKIQLGSKLTKGLGAGGKPSIGYEAALESIDQIKGAIADSDMIFVTAGMGGGTGTGAASVIAQAAKEMGALTVGVVTKPFYFEGKKRIHAAELGISDLRQYVDSLIVIPNDRLVQLAPKGATFIAMMKKADEVLYQAVKGISDLIMIPGLINLDFADVRSVMLESGLAMMGTGVGTGETRAKDAATRAIHSPLLEGVSIDGARDLIMNITCGSSMTIDEVSEAASIVQEAAHDEVNVFFGTVTDDSMGEEMHITVIATGIDSSVQPAQSAQMMPLRRAPATPAAPVAAPPAPVAATYAPPAPAPAYGHPAPTPTYRVVEKAHVMTEPAVRQPQRRSPGGNLNVPTYAREQTQLRTAPPMSGGEHSPGGEAFSYSEEDDFETPSFIRKQAN